MHQDRIGPGRSVRLPAGAVEADEWQSGPPVYRVVFGVTRHVKGQHGAIGTVRPTAIQLADGTIDDGSSVEPPVVHVNLEPGYALTAAQTRDLAQLLVAAAAEADQMSSAR